MGFKTGIKHFVSFLLHGETRPTYAKINLIQPGNILAGKKIIITGGGRGLGLAMASRFVSEGAEVLIAGRDGSTLERSAKALNCKYLRLDLCDTPSIGGFVDKAFSLLGGADCLVNNAGISLHEEGFTSVSPEQFDAQFDTNLKGAFFLTQSFILRCAEDTGDGKMRKILFVSSEAGETADERPYGLTKAALNSLVQGLAYRYVNKGFRINAIAPGVTASDMTGIGTDGDLTCKYNISGRCYLPEEVAQVAGFLLSDAADCLNGQILVCNEGKTINARWK